MKTIVYSVLAVSLLMSCGRDNDDISTLPKPTPEVKVNVKDFSLEKTEVYLKRGEKASIKILSGNGEYQISQYTQQVAIVNISNDKQSVEINALGTSGASTRIKVIDVKSKKEIPITIHIQ